MAPLEPGFAVKKAVSVWNQPIQADYKGVFNSLGKLALHAATGQWTELGGDALDGMTALGLEKDPPQLAWLLIRKALLLAMRELVRERHPRGFETEEKQVEALGERLDAALEQAEVTIDHAFFQKPASLEILGEVAPLFADWLEGTGLSRPAAESTARRLPSFFVLALHEEWRRAPGTYEPILTWTETPVAAAAQREQAWARYAARLQKMVDEPMFDEAFGLRQIYVPLRAFYVEQEKSKRPRRLAVPLDQEIDMWVASSSKTDTLRIVSGGPGSGKSSFAKMYAARAAREHRVRVLFIPLHQFNVTGSLPSAVGEFVRNSDALPGNPLDPDSADNLLLLIFDGLDELSQQGKFAAEVASNFLREVRILLETRNQNKRCLLAMVTGREPVIQANESELRDRRVLHALPYFLAEEPDGFDELYEYEAGTGDAGFIKEDQRQLWWSQYGRLAGKNYKGVPEALMREELDDITTQPLLNYLVALSYERGNLDFSQDLNLNDIYRDLLAAVHARAYEGRPHEPIRGLNLDGFIRVLEEIALSAWHGNGRTTTVLEIEEHCRASNLLKLLERFSEGAKEGVTRILTAFYFREFGRDAVGDRVFEFTHKSFREYLTALRIVRGLATMERELEQGRVDFDSGWTERQALHHWIGLCGPNPMDLELLAFVNNEVKRRGLEVARRWQLMLCKLIEVMLRVGMPLELLSPRLPYKLEIMQARNAEEGLIAVLSSCSRVTCELSRVSWSGEKAEVEGSTVPGEWISRLRGQRSGPSNRLVMSALPYLDFTRCWFYMNDFYGANLSRSNLKGSGWRGACLELANLAGANLEGANLWLANLVGANLEGANLWRANLVGANLVGANLKEANLKGADLSEAILREAKLIEANLIGANLRGANLRGADLEGAFVLRSALKGTRGRFIGTPRYLPEE